MSQVVKQYIEKISVTEAKGLRDFSLEFNAEGLTAILGPNGCGKSTILHLLACAYSRQGGGAVYTYPDFFLPVRYPNEQDAFSWSGTSFEYHYNINEVGKSFTVRKTPSRWCRYIKRPSRWISYIGIDTCIPDIEKEKRRSRIDFSGEVAGDRQILEDAKYILGRDYEEYSFCHRKGGRTNIRVSVRNRQTYTSLSMGAGEQRVFRILEEVNKSDPYGLILVDEIDLLLHQSSLKRLLEVLVEKARRKHLQIVFTAHNQSILTLSDDIEFRHIYQIADRTECLIGNSVDAIFQLTGESHHRDLSVFVEDELAKALVQKICTEEDLSTRVGVSKYGAIENCFTLIAGLHLGGQDLGSKLFVTDGDRYTSRDERLAQMKVRLSGTEDRREEERVRLSEEIKQFILEERDTSPEKYYHGLINFLSEDNLQLTPRHKELCREIKAMSVTERDCHKLFLTPFGRLGLDKATGYSLCADLIAETDKWFSISSEIRTAICAKLEKQRRFLSSPHGPATADKGEEV